MKKQTVRKSLQGLRAYLFSLLFAITSFTYLLSEWKVVVRAGSGVYETFKPLVENWVA